MIVRLVLPLLLLAAAAPVAPARDAAGNRMVALVALVAVRGLSWFAAKDGERSALRCTPDRRRCLRVVHAGQRWTLEIYNSMSAAPDPAIRIAVTIDDEISDVTPWPHVVTQPDGHILVGADITRSTSYSGGGASSSTLTLYDVAPGAAEPHEVLSVPSGGSAMIRACFSEQDMRTRAGACHDEYSFGGTLTLDLANRAGHPLFRFVTVAQTFPGPTSRDADNRDKRLTRRNLVWARDPRCSYTRMLIWADKAAGYAPDRPLPDCSDYLSF